MGEKVQGLRSIIGRHKIDRERLRIAQEMEKPKNIYAQTIDEQSRSIVEGKGGYWAEEGKEEKIGTAVIAKSIKYTLKKKKKKKNISY